MNSTLNDTTVIIVDLTILYIVNSIFIEFIESGITKIYLTTFDIPDTVIIISNAFIGEIYLTILSYVPPAIRVMSNSYAITQFSVFNIVPAIYAIHGCMYYIGVVLVNPSITDIILVFSPFIFICHTNKSIIAKLNPSVFDIPFYTAIFTKAFKGPINGSVIDIPPAAAIWR